MYFAKKLLIGSLAAGGVAVVGYVVYRYYTNRNECPVVVKEKTEGDDENQTAVQNIDTEQNKEDIGQENTDKEKQEKTDEEHKQEEKFPGSFNHVVLDRVKAHREKIKKAAMVDPAQCVPLIARLKCAVLDSAAQLHMDKKVESTTAENVKDNEEPVQNEVKNDARVAPEVNAKVEETVAESVPAQNEKVEKPVDKPQEVESTTVENVKDNEEPVQNEVDARVAPEVNAKIEEIVVESVPAQNEKVDKPVDKPQEVESATAENVKDNEEPVQNEVDARVAPEVNAKVEETVAESVPAQNENVEKPQEVESTSAENENVDKVSAATATDEDAQVDPIKTTEVSADKNAQPVQTFPPSPRPGCLQHVKTLEELDMTLEALSAYLFTQNRTDEELKEAEKELGWVWHAALGYKNRLPNYVPLLGHANDNDNPLPFENEDGMQSVD